MYLGKSNERDMITFFDRSQSRERSDANVEVRSRSISLNSNNSYQNFLKGNANNKKYFNLIAMDGFAMMERDNDEEKYNLQQTILKGMDVDGICEDYAEGNDKNYHLDKLFNNQGPYFTQTQRFEADKKLREKRRNRKKSIHHRGNFLDKIDTDIYKDDEDEPKTYCIANLFEDPNEKEIRMNNILRNKKKKKHT